MRSLHRISALIPALAFGAIGALFALLSVAEFLGERTTFVLLTLLLLGYNIFEIFRVRRSYPAIWLINPTVIASALTFVLGFGLGNLLFFLPPETIGFVGLVPDVSPAMVKLMWLALVGTMGMWMGYGSLPSERAAASVAKLVPSRWFADSETSRRLVVPFLISIATIARLAQIRLGIFGYSSNYDRLVEMGSYTQYFAIGASLGSIALVIASLEYYSDKRRPSARLWFVLSISIEVAFGLLSGFKSQVVMPLVIAGACRYLRSGRLPLVWIAAFFVGLWFAYALIEPFRNVRTADRASQATSAAEIFESFATSSDQFGEGLAGGGIGLSILARTSLVYVGSLGIEFRDEHQELPEGSPEFLKNLLLAPAYAFVPRLVWAEKPLGNLGLWYTQVVLEQDIASATAPSPVTYLYFVGGALAVFVGFFCFGAMHRLLLVITLRNFTSSRALFYLAMLPVVSVIDSSVDGVIVGTLRAIPLLMILQYLVYGRSGKRSLV